MKILHAVFILATIIGSLLLFAKALDWISISWTLPIALVAPMAIIVLLAIGVGGIIGATIALSVVLFDLLRAEKS